jgi:hypothetical protein
MWAVSGVRRKGAPLRPNNTTGNPRMAAMRDLPVGQVSAEAGLAKGSRECAPDDRLREMRES